MLVLLRTLYDAGDYGVWTFLFLTVLLGGAAALATGRALALTWRPLRQCIVYAVPLAFAIAFLHYALVGESVIPLEFLIEDVADAGGLFAVLKAIAWHLRGVAVQFLLLAVLSLAGYRLTRVRQMTTQYRFGYTANGPMHWRKIG
ncbi:MAG: hypothetical protein KDJ29_02140 [Hyphomicrobiales bacterium]|nr:hypothetical protein [Hyphomicrobiales bacterium]